MTSITFDLPEDINEDIVQFAKHIEESDQLTTTVKSSITLTTGKYAGEMGLKVITYDGHNSSAGEIVQDLADEFFGHHNYRCGHYEDSERTRTTIVPPTA